VHREADGIPRLINVICDRALLGAYAQERSHVDERTVVRAAAEVRGRGTTRWYRRPWRWITATAVVLALAAGVVALTPRPLAERSTKAPATAARPGG
jgi:general secretion pathway protein A